MSTKDSTAVQSETTAAIIARRLGSRQSGYQLSGYSLWRSSLSRRNVAGSRFQGPVTIMDYAMII